MNCNAVLLLFARAGRPLLRILLAGGSFLAHIQSSSGSQVVLQGRGSVLLEGPDPLHVHIAAATVKQAEDAKT
jgi:hypothetical protein